jgi:hypothetical protein
MRKFGISNPVLLIMSEGAPLHRAHLMIAVESSKRQQICQRLRDPFAKSSEAVGIRLS